MIRQNLKINLFITLILLSIGCESNLEKSYEYYQSGEIKLEVTRKNNQKHGLSKEYYKDGPLRKIQTWKEGKLYGKSVDYYSDGTVAQIFIYKNGYKTGQAQIFYSSGELMENQFYNEKGQLYYFEKFNKDGTRLPKMAPVGYLENDSVNFGDKVALYMKLGNVGDSLYQKGSMIIYSDLDKKGFPEDTLKLIRSKQNRFKYEFRSKKAGQNYLNGCLVYRKPLDSIDADYIKIYHFIKKFYVKND